ncbi:oxidoreductase [Mucilaginibacter pedocola]|uniref:Short-chain dehydrogenase n=1 Tax=Mucilaginibacter pedocola TaxID=1792845 RepID=A0A1S9PBK9_9SPHI|nr:oxidoreductase [Mucilaginibacter pedocola]OOQ58187.1 short-chain dehydrogenase [Mucilaginibacter pedocola]
MWTKKNIPDLSGKTIIVTGANAGIGYETALALYEAGAHVIIASRDEAKAAEAISKLEATGCKGSLEFIALNLSNLGEIKRFADEFKAKHTRLDVLINNAGVMLTPASKTDDGYELQFGTNHIGHFALTGHLYPVLKATEGARIVTVSSMAYLRGSINFDNLKSEQDYDAMREYCQSKLANVLFSLQLQRRIDAAGDGVLSLAVQPGANKTELARYMDKAVYDAAVKRTGPLMEPWQGALPSLYAAVEPAAKPYVLYSPDQDGGYRGYPAEFEITSGGRDEVIAQRLWEYSEKETGVVYP